ncbi:MAG TPA: hypothetical protein VMB66_01110 [Candidatus Acidoferrales bacterium]|nr:hypothetical protein [Candidatus Acidoferrales bacterium]
MAIDFLRRCEMIEECYEFFLGYAAQGVPTDQGSPTGNEVRKHLQQARDALAGMSESCRRAVMDQQFEPSDKYEAFCSTVDNDAQKSLVAIELVLAQPSISSQLIDNLNASSHLRALLTDLFLFGEIVRTRAKVPIALEGQ